MELSDFPPETIATAKGQYDERHPRGDWDVLAVANEPEAVAYCQLAEIPPADLASAEDRCDTDGRRGVDGAIGCPWAKIGARDRKVWTDWDALTDAQRAAVDSYHERESFMPMYDGMSKADVWDAYGHIFKGHANYPAVHNLSTKCMAVWIQRWTDAGSPAG